MLKELYDELSALYGSTGSADSDFGPAPKSGLTTVLIAREGDVCWFTLDASGGRVVIPNDVSLFGTITKVEDVMSTPSNPKYPPSRKLKVYLTGRTGTPYMLHLGFETAAGKSLVKSLNALSVSQLNNVAISVKPSDSDEKVVFVNATTAEGEWQRSDNETDIEVQYNSLRAALGQTIKESTATVATAAAPKKVPVKSVNESFGPGDADIPF